MLCSIASSCPHPLSTLHPALCPKRLCAPVSSSSAHWLLVGFSQLEAWVEYKGRSKWKLSHSRSSLAVQWFRPRCQRGVCGLDRWSGLKIPRDIATRPENWKRNWRWVIYFCSLPADVTTTFLSDSQRAHEMALSCGCGSHYVLGTPASLALQL